MNIYTKQKQSHRHRKQTYGHQKEKEEGGEEEQMRKMGLTNTNCYI